MDRPWAWDPSHGQAASRAGSRRPLRIAVIAAMLVIAGVLAAVLVAHAAPGGIAGLGADGLGGAGGLGTPSGLGTSSGRSRPVSVTALRVARVDLRGVPGQLTVTGTGAGPVRLTGQLQWHGQAPVAVVRLNALTHVLRLSYRCAAASPCTGNYRLTVPGRTATVLDLPSGHLVVLGVAGPLRITTGSADVTAAGLRSPVLYAAITHGHLSASFDRPPRQISMVLTSAQATLRLPGSVAYRVSQDVTAGFVRVAIPHAATAVRSVTARIASGELELLTSRPAVSR